MEKSIMSATLSNKDCIFDSCHFASVAEAVDWARGRGGVYTVIIGRIDKIPGVVLSYDSDEDKFSHYDGFEWVTVTPEEIASLI